MSVYNPESHLLAIAYFLPCIPLPCGFPSLIRSLHLFAFKFASLPVSSALVVVSNSLFICP
ncbi:hypothetical protein EDB92DRAFT_1898996 [Lactarius akahatsu]|uniref:Uncharacterized protein n=1 Tax=Lactarius akahatsu TaxID=416441 RepID=A0AAD4Q8M1_9AGAM|nr:hypothetical protein EDB92DRAFT_1898996 [Lactarius akahatsu]